MLLRTEVENRGQLWIETENTTDTSTVGSQEATATANGAGEDGTNSEAAGTSGHSDATTYATPANEASGNRDEENEEAGVYL